jgi:hypothetical protein
VTVRRSFAVLAVVACATVGSACGGRPHSTAPANPGPAGGRATSVRTAVAGAFGSLTTRPLAGSTPTTGRPSAGALGEVGSDVQEIDAAAGQSDAYFSAGSSAQGQSDSP